jgi:hypothetical protein
VTLAKFAAIVIQVAPFVAIITIELFGPKFLNRWEATFQQYRDNMFVEETEKKEFDHLAQHAYDHDAALQYFDLTLLTLFIIFGARIPQVVKSGQALVLAGVFLVTSLVVFATRWRVESYFKQRPPDKYAIEENFLFGFRYGTVHVIGSNILIVVVILVTELLVIDPPF